MKTLIIVGGLILSVATVARAADPKTERTWKAKCASCHGDDGKGQTDQGKKAAIRDVTTTAWQKEFSDEKIKAAIANGVNEERGGVKKEMKPYKDALKPEQIDQLAAFIRGLAK